MVTPPRYLVSHHVHRWHNLLVPTPGKVELEHRGTGDRRSVDEGLWEVLAHAARRPAAEEELVLALAGRRIEGRLAVRELIEARFLVEPQRDFWSDYVPVPGGEPPDLARDRLRWSRDVLDPHRLWLYPTWLGFTIMQWPPDMWAMQTLFHELRPDVVIETGLFRGGSAIFYASILELLGAGRVISVERRVQPEVRAALAAHPLGGRITIVEGSSIDPAVVAHVAELARGPGPRVVALDSDHGTAHVRTELEAYAPLVDARGKLVVFDTSMSLCPRHQVSNPHLAVRAFLAAHPEWRISPWAGASFVSLNEDGILERLPG